VNVQLIVSVKCKRMKRFGDPYCDLVSSNIPVSYFFADMAAPSLATPALGCMQEIQRQCFLLGIPLKTRHREVAPNQFEFAPLYGFVTTQIDQNLMVMQIIEETAASFGLAALFQEKPFQVRATGAMSCC
jgi:glutamine synthetase type III